MEKIIKGGEAYKNVAANLAAAFCKYDKRFQNLNEKNNILGEKIFSLF